MKRFTKPLLIIFGTTAVALGLVGIFLPVLPTTPFLLLAAFCYARSSDRCYDWLMTNPWFGEYIRNYREGRGILLRQKVTAISLVWLSIGYAILFAVSQPWLKLILLAIAIGVTTHLLRLKTFRPGSEPATPASTESSEPSE